eukprot:m.218391 g.218391  ORF g.218391 m.218391 type:complete len:190 (+) comp54117_c0_seq22:868-1437(+)
MVQGFIPLMMLVPMESVPEINATPNATSFVAAWENQAGAFRCMTGQPDDDDYPQKCSSKSAWIWVTLFIVGFVGGDLYANVLYKKTSAFWTMLLNTLSGPLTAAAFNFPQIVGQENYVQFGWYSGASFAVIFIGVIFRGTPTEEREGESKLARASVDDDSPDDLLPLLTTRNVNFDDDYRRPTLSYSTM